MRWLPLTILLAACEPTCFASKAICEANACMAKGKTAVQCETEANAAFCLANPKVCEEYRKKQ